MDLTIDQDEEAEEWFTMRAAWDEEARIKSLEKFEREQAAKRR